MNLDKLFKLFQSEVDEDVRLGFELLINLKYNKLIEFFKVYGEKYTSNPYNFKLHIYNIKEKLFQKRVDEMDIDGIYIKKYNKYIGILYSHIYLDTKFNALRSEILYNMKIIDEKSLELLFFSENSG